MKFLRRKFLKVCLPILSITITNLCYSEDTNVITINNTKLKSRQDLDKTIIDNKPRLEDFGTYNDFLHATYLYNKSQEELIKPNVIINLPQQASKSPEYTNLDSNNDVNSWGETISTPTETPVE